MKLLLKLIFLFIFIFLTDGEVSAQNSDYKNLNYEKLEKKIDSLHNNTAQALILISYYIQKSKKEGNIESLLYAYRYASMYYDEPNNYKYADSALMMAKKSGKPHLFTEAYLNKGTIYMYNQYYQKALDNVLMANKYAVDIQDDYLTNKTVYFIAQNKIYLGNYEDANKELKGCVQYFKNNINDESSLGKNSQMYYIYALISYLETNTKIGKQKDNDKLITEVIKYLKENKLQTYIPYFISIQGSDAYYGKDYTTAISKLQEALNLFSDEWSHITEVYYLGLSNWKLGKHAVAVKYLEEIDKEYEKDKKLDPQFRSAYELLIKYSDSIGDKNKQLVYINKLMLLDRSYEKNFKYLYSKINKEYDTQKLVAEKNRIEKSLQRGTYVGGFLVLLITVLLFYSYRFYHLQKSYKARFNEIIENKDEADSVVKENLQNEQILEKTEEEDGDNEYYNKIPGINPLLVKSILEKLQKFEEEKGYKNHQISIKLLSENFGTNYVYLSKVINEYRGTNFNIYINDLRLEFTVDLLKDRKYLHYDIKELSAISGFATPNSFSTNFVRKYNIKPSVFIKLMKNKT